MDKGDEFFNQIAAIISKPVATDDTPDESAFGPDQDATQEEILEAIEESVKID